MILVTGSRGQIGLAMTAWLEREDLPFLGLDVAPGPSDGSFLRCDLAQADPVELAEFCRPVTHVIHLAGKIDRSKSLASSYREQYRISVQGTRNLLKALSPTLRHVCFASSMTVYGAAASALVSEDEPLRPNCVYALAKLACERVLRAFGSRKGVRVACLRYASAYGPGPLLERAIPSMIERLLKGRPPEVNGDGSVIRDYIFLDDLCEATILASLRESDGIFNVGSGVGISTLDLARVLIRLTGRNVEPLHSKETLDAQASASLVYDISKMRRELGFIPRISLEEGLRKTIRHFQALSEAQP